MNIFFLDHNPTMCAEYHFDIHVSKMVVEYAQLLSTAHRVLDDLSSSSTTPFYKATHINHPSAVWVRSSIHHYNWLYQLFRELSLEYTFRFGRTHATWAKLGKALAKPPISIPDKGWVDPPQCMPDTYTTPESTVTAYRNYYMRGKSPLFRKWRGRATPYWATASERLKHAEGN
jgi:hypothetical protein